MRRREPSKTVLNLSEPGNIHLFDENGRLDRPCAGVGGEGVRVNVTVGRSVENKAGISPVSLLVRYPALAPWWEQKG